MIKKILLFMCSFILMLAIPSSANASDYNNVWDYLENNNLSYTITEKGDDVYYYVDLDKYPDSTNPDDVFESLRNEYHQKNSR